MVGEYGEVLVLDWGMAKIMGQESPRKAPSEPSSSVAIEGVHVRDSNLTIGSGYILGTPSYMAPEQAANQPIDLRTDIYALGGILYAILTLRPPHEEGEVYEMLEDIKAGRILSPLTYNPSPRANPFDFLFGKTTGRSPARFPHCPDGQIPESLSMITMKALSLKPEDRYQDVRDLQKDIRAYEGGFITSAETRGLYKSLKLLIKRHRTESVLIAASLLIILTLTAAYVIGVVSALKRQLKAEEERRNLEEKTTAERRRNWRLVFKDDFTDPDVLSRWEINGQWETKDGELRIWGTEDQHARLKIPIPGDVRLVFDCREEGENLTDVSCFLGATRLPGQPAATPFVGGYLFQYGGNFNKRITLLGPSGILWNKRGSPLAPGARYHVDAQKAGDRLILNVNGQTIFNVQDRNLVVGADHASVGFYGYRADTRYAAVRVYTRDAAIAADLLETAEDLMNRGSYIAARELFQQVLNASFDPKRTAKARQGLDLALRHIALTTEFPSIKTRLLKTWPRADIRLGSSGLIVRIDAMGVEDLDPLRGLLLEELRCDYNRIASLDPLKNAELKMLACSGNRISSLDPLKGNPLSRLECTDNEIRSLDPLAGMPLKRLACGMNSITNLEPLRGMELGSLHCPWNQIASLAPLQGMPLVSLGIDGNPIADFSPLKELLLIELHCSSCNLKDLEFLRGMDLSGLICNDNRITSLEPLRGMKLSLLRCEDNPIQSLGPVLDALPREACLEIDHLNPVEKKQIEERMSQPQYRTVLRDTTILWLLKHKDYRRLQSLSTRIGKHRYLLIPKYTSWPEAKQICEEVGGHLVTLTNREEMDFLYPQIPKRWGTWIGLVLEGKERRWITGEPCLLTPNKCPTHYFGHGLLLQNGNLELSSPDKKTYSFCVEWDD
jgi:hypothetical protein